MKTRERDNYRRFDRIIPRCVRRYACGAARYTQSKSTTLYRSSTGNTRGDKGGRHGSTKRELPFPWRAYTPSRGAIDKIPVDVLRRGHTRHPHRLLEATNHRNLNGAFIKSAKSHRANSNIATFASIAIFARATAIDCSSNTVKFLFYKIDRKETRYTGESKLKIYRTDRTREVVSEFIKLMRRGDIREEKGSK